MKKSNDSMEEKNELCDEIKSVLKSNYECAREILATEGDLVPMAFMRQLDKKWMITPIPFGNGVSKDRAIGALRAYAKKEGIVACILLMEAWTVLATSMKGVGDVPPSKHPDRQEVVTILVQVKGNPGAWTGCAPISRTDGKPSIPEELPDIEYVKQTMGRMLLFPNGDME